MTDEFLDAMKLMNEGRCPLCKCKIGDFRDELSRREYKISGLCQKCQDKIFGV